MALEDDIRKAEEEEIKSQEKYMMMAHEAEQAGLHNMAGMMKEMANDEGRHAQMMRSMVGFGAKEEGGMIMGELGREMMSQEEAKRLGMGEMHKRMMGSGESSRPFPETYGDWVSLAEDIKAKMPPESWGVVNGLLLIISDEVPEAQEAKRWLVNKAGELGIE